MAAPDARARAWQVALPELDGALEPIVFAGRDSNTGKSHSLPDRIDTLCNRAINWAKCAAPTLLPTAITRMRCCCWFITCSHAAPVHTNAKIFQARLLCVLNIRQ